MHLPVLRPKLLVLQAPGTPTQAPGTPTQAPGSTGYCPAYSASNTYYAYQNYATCSITACSGDTVYMTTCSPGSYSGDTYLIHPLVLSWLITMTTVVAHALISPIHSHLVAAPMNLGRDAIVLILALAKCTTLVVQ